jgi:hypothetical protein
MLRQEFDRQVNTLLTKGYPNLVQKSEEAFIQLIEALREKVEKIQEIDSDHIPFVIVVKHELLAAELALPLIEGKNKVGIVNMTPLHSSDFKVINELDIPESPVYLITDVATGQDTLNVTPAAAFESITKQGRSPLTIDEGVALVTHFPEVLTDKEKYNSFSMLGSRRNDQRVPAFWISYGQPRLGWCWNNNPHTWLGSASCGSRL